MGEPWLPLRRITSMSASTLYQLVQKASVFLLLCGLLACAQLPDNNNRPASHSIAKTADTFLGQRFTPLLTSHPNQTGFYLLLDDVEAFAIRLKLIDVAEKSIDAQYYLLNDDLTGRLFLQHLLAAADRGVRVRLLLDDMGTEGDDALLAALASHPQFSVRVFNPFRSRRLHLLDFATRLREVDRRMHNKAFTVDNLVSIVGGRNIGDEYYSASDTKQFGDLDVLSVGGVTRTVSHSFDLFWNNELSYPIERLAKSPGSLDKLRTELQTSADDEQAAIYQQRMQTSAFIAMLTRPLMALEWSSGRVYYDPPEKVRWPRQYHDSHFGPLLEAQMGKTRESLLLVTPYFVPGKRGVSLLEHMAREGMQVYALTNSLAATDVKVVHAGYAKYRYSLLKAGVKLYEMKPDFYPGPLQDPNSYSVSSLHTKLFVFDQQRLLVGSMNLDPRSAHFNTELGILIENPKLAQRMAEEYQARLHLLAYELRLRGSEGNEWIEWREYTPEGIKRYIKDPKSAFLERMGLGLLGLLPYEHEL